MERAQYAVSNRVGRLVLPRANDLPPGSNEGDVYTLISIGIASQLRLPVVTVALRYVAVFWAAVPEASVHEDRDLPPAEHDVGSHGDRASMQAVIDAKAGTTRVERGTNGALGARVSAGIARHALRDLGVERHRIGQRAHLLPTLGSGLTDS